MGQLIASMAALAAVVVSTPAFADDYETFKAVSVTFLYGDGFEDVPTGNVTTQGKMTTLTLDAFVDYAWGDSFFFFDLASGRFGPTDGPEAEVSYKLYGEWQPRFSLSKIFNAKIGAGFLSDVLLAAELNRGAGFTAGLYGVGTTLEVPGFAGLAVNGYYRDDNFNDPTYQVTTVWTVPIPIGPTEFVFQGFADVYGTDAQDVNLLTQPQLALIVNSVLPIRAGSLQIGSEVYVHLTEPNDTVAPQIMGRWIW